MAVLSAIVDDVVRRERGRIVGGLLRFCGELDAAEEAFQDAVVSALSTWRDEVPANPGAWLMTTAKTKAMDARRHRAVVEANAPLLRDEESARLDDLFDDHLRLIFTCCHPALAIDNRIALTLKVVCGFTTEEIARAFVTTPATVSQRILRAKQQLEGTSAQYAIPEGPELEARVSAVLGVLYALFNEGHVASTGALMRLDLQAEALRLCRLTCELVPREPEAFGLLAIMAFSAARASTRVDGDGVPVLLEAQDRAQWDRELLREGFMALQRARSIVPAGPYVLQAEIAAVHVKAASWATTDWVAIVRAYDALAAVSPSPIVSLNRAIAVSMRDGAEAGLLALEPLAGSLSTHHLFFAARAEMLARLGRDARGDLARALSLVMNEGERRLLERRMRLIPG